MAYFPPRPQMSAKLDAYKRCVNAVIQWLDGILCSLAERAVPLIGFDLNDGFGLRRENPDIIPILVDPGFGTAEPV